MSTINPHTVQSRQKHRKVLGVGENAVGDIPRSKISQLLGTEDLNHIVIEQGEYPKGLRFFQWFICIMFGVVGLINIFYPQHFYRSATPRLMDPNSLVRRVADDLKSKIDDNSAILNPSQNKKKLEELESHFYQLQHSLDMLDIPVRLYGTACLSLSALFFIVAIINKDNRRAIRIALVVQAIYFLFDILVTWLVVNPLNTDNSSWWSDPVSIFWLTLYKILGICLSLYYYTRTCPVKPRDRRMQD